MLRRRGQLPGSIHLGRFAKAIKPMAQTQNRVLPQHTRTGVTHHGFDLFTPNALIAMNRTLRTDGLVGPKPAALEPDGSIIEKLPALRAKGRVNMVMAFAVTADHRGNGPAFPGKPLAGRASTASFALCRHWSHFKGFGGSHIIQIA